MKRKVATVVVIVLSCFSLVACGKKNKEPDEIVFDSSLFEQSTESTISVPSTPTGPGQSLDEILGRVPESTPEPTVEPSLEVPETTPDTTETPDLSSAELADDLFNLLSQSNETEKELSSSEKTAKDAMNIFASNIEKGNYIPVDTAAHDMQLNTSECTVVSRAENGSIIKFTSNSTTDVNSILVVYVTDLTAWTVIGENDVIYALMPTPEDASTEYEKQIVSAIIAQNANGKELNVELIYPYINAFDGTNNCAVYMVTTDGTFKVGSNAKTYAFYKYDYVK